VASHRFFACFLLLAACGDGDDAPPAEPDVRTEILATTTSANENESEDAGLRYRKPDNLVAPPSPCRVTIDDVAFDMP
jgi:hypothetical protein